MFCGRTSLASSLGLCRGGLQRSDLPAFCTVAVYPRDCLPLTRVSGFVIPEVLGRATLRVGLRERQADVKLANGKLWQVLCCPLSLCWPHLGFLCLTPSLWQPQRWIYSGLRDDKIEPFSLRVWQQSWLPCQIRDQQYHMVPLPPARALIAVCTDSCSVHRTWAPLDLVCLWMPS